MKIIYNTLIPFKGYSAMAFWPFIFARKELTEKVMNHESIHCRQQIEVMVLSAIIIGILVLIIGISPWWFILVPFVFYVLYLTEYIIRCIMYGDRKKAYKNIAVEQEAYLGEEDLEYLKHRTWFAWLLYY